MEAAKGCNKDMSVKTRVICNRCNGKKAEPGTTHSKCHSCNGTGQVTCELFQLHVLLFDIFLPFIERGCIVTLVVVVDDAA